MKNLIALIAFVPLAACGGNPPEQQAQNDAPAAEAPVPVTVALNSGDGTAAGEITATQDPNGVTIKIAASGLTAGAHAVHVHAVGQCAGPKFESAGPHWNPTDKKHGRDNPAGAHLGDMANFEAGADGRGETSFLIAGATLREGTQALADGDGAALVIHAKADDYKTDPSGDSGDRVSCALIGG